MKHRWILVLFALNTWSSYLYAAKPTFENRTPVVFSREDSTVAPDAVVSKAINVLVDLDQSVNSNYPVIGHFHSVERSVKVGSIDTDGMHVDVAMSRPAPQGNLLNPNGIHMAWIEQTGSTPRSTFPYTGGSTPLYQVLYARSDNGGATFNSPRYVSLVHHGLQADGNGKGFSTLDLEVDSRGNPRIAYAFISTGDRERKQNVYLAYSEDGGNSWKSPLKVNDTAVGKVESRSCGFPRLAIDDRDQIFISYARGLSNGSGSDDIMLSKAKYSNGGVSLLQVGESGIAGTGGVRLTPNGDRGTGVDIGIGDNDALHVVYFNDSDNRIEHKRLATDETWNVVNGSGWNQNADGALLATFVDERANNSGIETDVAYYFPSMVVDRSVFPDRVYALYKYADGSGNEGVHFNYYDEDGSTGSGAAWNGDKALWREGSKGVFPGVGNNYSVELDWEWTDRISAVVDARKSQYGDLHIAFSAGYSGAGEQDLYYARYNGSVWSLPEKVADDDSDTAEQDGLAASDVYIQSPSLAMNPDSSNIFMAFVGGLKEGFGFSGQNNVNHHAYFKVLGRDVVWQDQSVPVGAYQYYLSYKPVNPQNISNAQNDNMIYVHVADPQSGSGIGSRGDSSDGFLSGEWESVGVTLSDTDKFYEGRINENSSSGSEWGDDNDKVGLLVKLNVLGSDSTTNLQSIISNSGKSSNVSVKHDPTGSFVAAGSFFSIGASVDVVASNSSPTISIKQPDGNQDVANNTFQIQYNAVDADDDIGSGLSISLYAYPASTLKSVQDIRIFATLIADENDSKKVSSYGTDDLMEGSNQVYTWDDPPDELKKSALFASIQGLHSGEYYIYGVIDDGVNPPQFSVSLGALTIRHGPIVRQVDPIVSGETVDTGIRSGNQSNPYDLDFSVVDYDSEAAVQLFYSAHSGLTSLSIKGVYPNNQFVLGKSLSGTRATSITGRTTLSNRDHEYSWDVTNPVVKEGDYYIYAVATDSLSFAVAHSTTTLKLRHSPSFTFYEPSIDTQRIVDSGSQPIFSIQWQKGPGDNDIDSDASIDLYFTTDDPAVSDYQTTDNVAVQKFLNDPDTHLIVSGLKENIDGVNDIYSWDFRNPAKHIPANGERVWIYALSSDGSNTIIARGGSITVLHSPHIILKNRMPEIYSGDVVRLEWESYWADDGQGTDDAYIRLYATEGSGYTSLVDIEEAVSGGQAVIINSDDGTTSGQIKNIRESSDSAINWNTGTSDFVLGEGTYSIYAAIVGDATFYNGASGRISEASNRLIVGGSNNTNPQLAIRPNRVIGAPGDTLTFEVAVQSNGSSIESIGVVLDFNPALFTAVNSNAPFTDLGNVFAGGTIAKNGLVGDQLRFTKTKVGGEIVGNTNNPIVLARFKVILSTSFSGNQMLAFSGDSSLGVVGSSSVLRSSNGLSVQSAQVVTVDRGTISGTVLLEGRSQSIGNHSTLLDVHLRTPGATYDLVDGLFRSKNDDHTATQGVVEVQTGADGELFLSHVPVGRYVLVVKDSSHLSARTDTILVRHGENIYLHDGKGFYASDIRGDRSRLLPQEGRLLRGGDATGDNEVDEDDVNAVDAAWGTNKSVYNFSRSDMNNDGRVGVEDLSLATSNISNSTGFGAPPVFKSALERSSDISVELIPVNPDKRSVLGEELEFVLLARDLQDAVAYEIILDYDPANISILEPVQAGTIFDGNRRGVFTRIDHIVGTVSLAQARYGRDWQVNGDGELLRLRIRSKQNTIKSPLHLRVGKIVRSDYSIVNLTMHELDLSTSLPEVFTLQQNYPNPFNPSTIIPFSVPLSLMGSVPVTVEIYNTLGQRIRRIFDPNVESGFRRVLWDGLDASGFVVGSGVYFYRVQVGQEALFGSMTMKK